MTDRQVLVMMTALPLTVGHEFLIDFAKSVAKTRNSKLNVLLCSRPHEPVSGDVREQAIRDFAGPEVNVLHYKENMPQNPSEVDTPEEFWNMWRRLTEELVPGFRDQPENVVVASEDYGIKLAESLGVKFLNCDIARQVIDVSASRFRDYPLGNFHMLSPHIRPALQFKVTLFGAESTGKTTLAKCLTSFFDDSLYTPEWAREYLEKMGPETTMERMDDIVHGQYALQKAAYKASKSPIVIQDTDLLSTLGYYHIFNDGQHPQLVEDLFRETKSDLYVLMPTENRFQEDVLRYGGDKRQSDNDFWIDLLEEYDCDWMSVPLKTSAEQGNIVFSRVEKSFERKMRALEEFVRT